MQYITTKKDYDNLSEWEKQHIKNTYNSIIKGAIIADVVSVSKSGMTRRIKFYYIKNNKIIRATNAINFLLNKGYSYIVNDEGLKVSGAGMDMTFHTLYNCIEYKKRDEWGQNYNIL
jgi:tRNA(Ile2) C34 agmatinyltransferase TiaS